MKYFYKLTESEPTHRLYTVGYEDSNGNWHPDSDWNSQEDAAQRAAYLNGNSQAIDPKGTNEKLFKRVMMARDKQLADKFPMQCGFLSRAKVEYPEVKI